MMQRPIQCTAMGRPEVHAFNLEGFGFFFFQRNFNFQFKILGQSVYLVIWIYTFHFSLLDNILRMGAWIWLQPQPSPLYF